MKLRTIKKVLCLVFGEDYRQTDVYIEVEYYKTTYGEDADGNRGIPALEFESCEINIPSTCDKNKIITNEEHDELYKDAFAEVMSDWETWIDED